MARRPRLQYAGAIYHVMSRGNRKAAIVEDDADRRSYMAILGEIVTRYHLSVYAACLMDNHYHALLAAPRGNLSAAMQQINGNYSRTFNERHHLTGHTFEGRFVSRVVQWERYFRWAARYVVVNPVKAGLCANAESWPWSTYRATAGLEPAPEWLNIDWLESTFEADSRETAQEMYRRYVNMRTATRTTMDLAGEAYGTKAFQRAVRGLSKMTDDGRRVVAEVATPPLPLEILFIAGRNTRYRRDDLIYTAHVEQGYPLAKIASYLALNDSTVRKAFRRYNRRLWATTKTLPRIGSLR